MAYFRYLFLVLVSLFIALSALAQETILDIFDNPKNSTSRTWHGCKIETFSVKNEDPYSNWANLEFIWLKISSDVEIQVADVRENGSYKELFEELAGYKDLVILSGGFYDRSNDPEGLVIINGKEVNPFIDWEHGGILVQEEDFFQIVPVSYYDYLDLGRIKYALQSKPIVVEDQEVVVSRKMWRRQNRIGIGLSENDELLICLGITKDDSALSLYEFGQLVSFASNQGGPGGKIMLALDGGPSVHVYVPALKRHFGYKDSGYIANVLKVKAK